MEFRIEQSEQQEKVEPILTLRLERDNDDVNVVGTAENGNEYHLISFNSNGTLYRFTSIDSCTGFKLSKNGQIKERK